MSKIISIRISKEHERRIQFIKDYYESKYPEFGKLSTSDVIKYSIASYYNIIEEIKIMDDFEKNKIH